MVRAVIKFIYGKPALKCGRTLAIADLHAGLEKELDGKGIRLGSQAEAVGRELLGLVEEENAQRLVLIGDVKHRIGYEERTEMLTLRKMLGELAAAVELVIVPGNHDAGIAELAPGAKVAPGSGIALGNFGFAHGHSWPSEGVMAADWLAIGHAHPCVEFTDRNGFRSVERAWVVAEADEKALLARYPGANPGIRLVIMPCFNPLAGGMPLNGAKGGTALGPVLKSSMFKMADGETYLLNGVGLGKVSRLPRNKQR